MARRKKTYHTVHGVQDFYSGMVGVVDIDQEISEAVITVCAKRYKTIASCAGHKLKKKADYGDGLTYIDPGYIWFEKKPRKKIPNSLYWDTDNCLRWQPKTVKGLKQCHKDLLEWAKSL